MGFIAHAAVAAILACAAASAAAQIYRCNDGDRVSFSDRPCDRSGSAARPLPSGPGGGLDFDVMTRHYTVDGRDARSVYVAMKTRNPGGFAGWARWRVAYRYTPRERSGHCTVAHVQVTVRGDILMPRWPQLNDASPQDQQWWHEMYAGLMRHEQGHVQHGREFAMFLKERLLGIGRIPCAELESRARQEYQRLYDNLQHRDREYDWRTEHGLRQDNPKQ